MTNGNSNCLMTAEEFDLVASVILSEGGHNRKALLEYSNRVEEKWSQELVDYFRFISGEGHGEIARSPPGPENSLSKLLEGFRQLRAGDPANAIESFLLAFELGLGSRLQYWTPLGLFGIGASCLWIQRLDLARDAFLRCIESGWALSDHAAIAKGYGGLGNLFMAAGLPHLAFDAYSTDLGFIQSNHYFIPILRARRSLAYAMTQTHDRQRGLGMLLAEAGDFFDRDSEDRVSALEKKYQLVADEEIYRGLAACSVVWQDNKTFTLLPEPEKRGASSLSVIAYHLAGMYHYVEERDDHWRSARDAFKELTWSEHPVRRWFDSLLSKDALDTCYVPRLKNPEDRRVLMPLLSVPTLSSLDRFREPNLTDSWSEWEKEEMQLNDAIKFTLQRGMLSNSR